MNHPLKRYFAHEHLVGEGRYIAEQYAEFVEKLDSHLVDSAEKTVMMRKLLEAKDAGVRATLYA
jgi:hypothetical protein